jgi:thiol:disulfide interchange protein DsbA
MSRKSLALAAFSLIAFAANAATPSYEAGKHYTVLPQAQRTTVPAGKIEVLEVFSYGCPACNQFRPFMKQLASSLPATAQLAFLPASWNPGENWHVFQRAYLAAQSLGVADKAHEAMFDAIWTTGELGIADTRTGRIKAKLPTIEDVARLYERVAGVKAADFVAAAKSFGVEAKMKQADAQIIAMKVNSTPTLVVNGKYRVDGDKIKSSAEMIEVVKFLVAKEAAAAPKK